MSVPVDGPALTVAAVARRLGVAPATLRTWERRYGVGPTGRAPGERRRYTSADLDRLERMRRLTHDGVSPGEAARAVLAAVAEPPDEAAVPLQRGLPTSDGELLALEDAAGVGARGGRIRGAPRAGGAVRGLARAAMSLDGEAVTGIVAGALRDSGVIDTWDRLVSPVLRALGDRWAATGDGVDAEHLVTEAVAGALRVVRESAPTTPTARPVLLCGAQGEEHCLALHALAAALAERGIASRLLGPDLPDAAVVSAVRRTGAAVLFVWAQVAETARAGFLGELPRMRPPTVVVVGGAGWDPDTIPRRTTYAHDLGDAVHLVALAAGVG